MAVALKAVVALVVMGTRVLMILVVMVVTGCDGDAGVDDIGSDGGGRL